MNEEATKEIRLYERKHIAYSVRYHPPRRRGRRTAAVGKQCLTHLTEKTSLTSHACPPTNGDKAGWAVDARVEIQASPSCRSRAESGKELWLGWPVFGEASYSKIVLPGTESAYGSSRKGMVSNVALAQP